MKFYLDEDPAPAIAVALRMRGVDAVSAMKWATSGLGTTSSFGILSADQRSCDLDESLRLRQRLRCLDLREDVSGRASRKPVRVVGRDVILVETPGSLLEVRQRRMPGQKRSE